MEDSKGQHFSPSQDESDQKKEVPFGIHKKKKRTIVEREIEQVPPKKRKARLPKE